MSERKPFEPLSGTTYWTPLGEPVKRVDLPDANAAIAQDKVHHLVEIAKYKRDYDEACKEVRLRLDEVHHFMGLMREAKAERDQARAEASASMSEANALRAELAAAKGALSVPGWETNKQQAAEIEKLRAELDGMLGKTSGFYETKLNALKSQLDEAVGLLDEAKREVDSVGAGCIDSEFGITNLSDWFEKARAFLSKHSEAVGRPEGPLKGEG